MASGPPFPSVDHLLPKPALLPDEDLAQYEGLRASLLADLAPRTAYERTLAENLVEIEWQQRRLIRLRDEFVRSEFRRRADSIIQDDDLGDVLGLHTNPRRHPLANALVAGEPAEDVAAAQAELARHSRSTGEITAAIYHEHAAYLSRLERQIAEMESRRRRLGDDYERLRRKRAPAAEPAEVVDEQ